MRRSELRRMYELEETYWWFVGRRRLVRRLIHRYAPDREPLRILDAGCGSGGTLRALEGVGQLHGCDVSPAALAMCRERGLCNLRASSVEQLAYPDESFDVVVSCDVLEHVPDDQAAVDEMVRVLTPGGILVTTVPAHRSLWSEHDEALAHLRRYENEELRSLFEKAGLEVLRFTHAVSVAIPAILVYRALRRITRRRDGEKKTALVELPTPINTMLIGFLGLESRLMNLFPLPFGASLVAVCKKPQPTTDDDREEDQPADDSR